MIFPNDAEALKAFLLSLRTETELACAQTEAARDGTARIAADLDRLENEQTILTAEVERLTE